MKITDYFMDEHNLVKIVKNCEKFANQKEHNYSDYHKEINKVKKLMENDLNMAWMKLISTKVFYLVYGIVKNTYGQFITVES